MAESSPGQQPELHLPDFLQEEFERAAEGRSEREHDHMIRHNLTMGGHAEEVGIRATNADGDGYRSSSEDKKKEEERQRKAQRDQLIAMLNARLNQLNQQIAWYDEQIEQAEGALDAIDELERLHREGRLDLDNPEHAALLERAGILAEDYENDPDGAFSRRREFWQEQLEQWREQRGELQRERQDVEGLIARAENARSEAEIHEVAEEIAQLEGRDEIYEAIAEVDRQVVDSAVDEARGYDDNRSAFAQSGRVNENFYEGAGSSSVSYAELLEPTPIETGISLRCDFAAACNAEPATESNDLDFAALLDEAEQEQTPSVGHSAGPGMSGGG